jgi:glycerophosphoryl diester phosphodiesterase
VLHYDTHERLTVGSGRVRAGTFEEIRALDAGSWRSAAFAGVRVPSLGEVLRYARGKLLVNVELKDESLLGEGLERRVADAIARERMTRSVIVSSFNPFALWRLRRVDPRLPTALLYSADLPAPLRDRWLMNLIRPDALHPSKQLASFGHIRAARGRGHRVNVWTVNDPETIRHLSWVGIDGIITDTPGKMVQLRGLA